ncbi:MAG: 3-phosphoshikimate 1-carboxyvinyltransferase [Alphaproteobacteria bacterium]|nr:3-phosphoshikimate 1-carboxyvinyltransferase [Alphaproteobacteria bacterium]
MSVSVASDEASSATPDRLLARAGGALRGRGRVPGDKSVSHRALMFAALAVGETAIEGLLEGEDVLATAAALRAMGATIERRGAGSWRVWGCGVGGLAAPSDVLDLGNSGTSVRLLAGILAGHNFTAMLTGDASLRRRPMGRVIDPLTQMGARFQAAEGGRLPATITGTTELVPIDYRLPVASAQVKSAVLLAGLHAAGRTSVIEAAPTRDHTERMLRHFGAEVTVTAEADGTARITVTGEPELRPAPIAVPTDPSSAAFPAVAALLVPSSAVTIEGVLANPTRTGLFATLQEMGADIAWTGLRTEGGEPTGNLVAAGGLALRGVEVPASRAPSMIDEYPVLAMAAACASGTTIFHGVGELRVKESDRLAAIARGLAACGIAVEEGPETLAIHGAGGPPPGGATVDAALDHRIAMAFLVLGLATKRPVTVTGASAIDTSFPGFVALMAGLGADIAVG